MERRTIHLEPYLVCFLDFQALVEAMPRANKELWIQKSQLGGTLKLIKVPLDWSMLKAVTSFWDPKRRIFRFGQCDLCPTFEKHEDFLGLNIREGQEVEITYVKPSYSKDVAISLGVFKNRISKGIILDYPLKSLTESGWQKEGDFEDLHKFHAFMLPTIRQLLLSTKKTHVDGPVTVVANQVEQGRTLVPTILTEFFKLISFG